MNPRERRAPILFVVIALLFSFHAAGQETPSAKVTTDPKSAPKSVSSDATVKSDATVQNNSTIPTLSLSAVETGLAAVESDSSLNDDQKAALRTAYAKITDVLESAERFQATAQSCKASLEVAPKNAATNREQLETLQANTVSVEVDEQTTSSDLRNTVNAQRAKLQELKDELDRVREELVETEGRPLEIGKRLPQAEREFSKVRNQWDTLESADDKTSPSKRVEAFAFQADAMELTSEIAMMKQENLSQSVRQDELESQRDLLGEKVQRAQATLDTLSKFLDSKLAKDVARIQASAQAASGNLPNDKEVQTLAAEVKLLASQLEGVRENTKRVVPVSREMTERIQEVNLEYRDVKNELSLGSNGGELTQVLLELAQRADPDALTQDMPITVEQSRLEWFKVRKRRRGHSLITSQFEDHPSKAVQELIAARMEILEKHQKESADLTQSLAKLRTDKQRYVDLCEEVQAFVTESLFGFHIRSCAPVEIQTLTELPQAIMWLLSGEHASQLTAAFKSQSSVSTTVAMLAIVLILIRGWLISLLKSTGPPTRRTSTDRFVWTTRALLLTLLLAAPIPMLVYLLASVLGQITDISGMADTTGWLALLAQGCGRVVPITAVVAFLIEACRPAGLAIVHFKWNDDFAARLSSTLRAVAIVYLPCMVLIISLRFGEGFEYFDSLGRVIFMVAHLWMISVFPKLIDRSVDGPLGQQQVSATRVERIWKLIRRPLLFGIPVALILFAASGYLMTAVDLSLGLCVSAGIFVILQIAYDLTIRWFEIRRHRLALAEAIMHRKARLAAEADHRSDQEISDLLQLNEEEELGLGLAVAGDQTIAIIRLIFNLAIVIVLYNYWSNVIPLTAALDTIAVPMAGGLSLLNLVWALLVASVAIVIVRNLPGLLEFSVLRNSNIEAGTRNAIYTLCQYAVIGLALIALSNTLELDWAKLGWMAAALSVGLGFGLQEVVGNFVCGLIVLFERPIRVGDVVTIDGTTGTVTNINMRATTITNWDRQDFVVPNKNLITGTILNWTLNASVNRLVIPVGVSHGSDTEQACQILLDVAADHPEVLKDPQPIASFDQFADSSLKLILRAYLPTLDKRISTTTELNTEIAKRFAAAGIEIPLPQQDLHLRTGWEQLSQQDRVKALPSEFTRTY